MNTQEHRNPNSAREKDLHFHTMSSNPAELYFLAGAKFAYVLLNTPTACPPRTAVPVNRLFFSRCRCWAVFRHKFGQVCDFPNDVRANPILLASVVPAAIQIPEQFSQLVTHQYKYDLSGNRTNAVYGITGRQVRWEYDPHNRIAQITDQQGYTATTNISSGQNLQAAINGAAAGSRGQVCTLNIRKRDLGNCSISERQ